MTHRIPDEAVDAFTTSGTYDQIAQRLRDRYTGLIDTLIFPNTPRDDAERECLRAIVAELKMIPTGGGS